MSYDGNSNMNELDSAKPADTESRNVVGAAIREIKRVLKNVFSVAHNPDGTLKPISSADQLGSGIVTTDKLANGAVTSDKISDGAIAGAKLTDGSVTLVKLAADSVDAVKLKNDAVVTAKLSDGAVTEAKIGALSVTGGKIGAEAITAEKLAAGAVTDAKITNMSLSKLLDAQDAYIIVGNGTNWTAVPLTGDVTITNTGVVSVNATSNLAHFADHKTRGTNGGNYTSGWARRDLMEIADDGNLIVFSGNTFTLVAGKYLFWARVPGLFNGRHQARLLADIGPSNSVLLWGASAKSDGVVQTDSVISGFIEVQSSWVLSIEQWFSGTSAAQEFGQAASSDNSTPYANHVEVYTEGYVIKVG